ncbi:biliverdin-producing heme oxygenase [Mucilaginibacter sp. Bleaf8]|uniref:biliverdin-producing heme oxygenase n=1 Tax=Mucilaginibacter sp. Bleaf8 TaxID=2834430 RepID=UPI001BCE8C2E|nr:biliverdin-producing heme oxygenase [Mucilaginibacter sp. Bleaf8]MBS7565454.1 biliverdin-producing heme oxygenase [Mucilaginibacter sp. Bleaf8]
MLAEKLKTDTLVNHQQLEKMLVSRMKGIRSKLEYVELLQLFYGYFGGLEEKINPYIGINELPDYAQRRKSAALAADISALGGTPAAKATGTDLPEITNAAQAFAALYVIEGSTLGGKIISQMMARQLDISDGLGLSFFNGYGEDTDRMWTTFKQALNNQAGTKTVQDDVINTANQTFTKFKNWAEQHGE